MAPREPTPADGDRIREIVESAMTTSYRLSPQQIERLTDEQFGEDVLAEKIDGDDTVVRVVDSNGEDPDDVEGTVVAGYVEGVLDGEGGELRWLFVDPEHRGQGLGTTLYETAAEALREAGARQLRATTLEANAEGQDFFERFGLEQVEDRRIDVADESLVEYVYADASADEAGGETAADTGVETAETGDEAADIGDETTSGNGGEGAASDEEAIDRAPDDASHVDVGDLELPDTETRDGTTTATTEDGQTVYVALDERESGTDAPLFATYTDDDRSDRYGYYCSNCGSLDVAMDSADRIECRVCGNDHASRSSESYDDSYL